MGSLKFFNSFPNKTPSPFKPGAFAGSAREAILESAGRQPLSPATVIRITTCDNEVRIYFIAAFSFHVGIG